MVASNKARVRAELVCSNVSSLNTELLIWHGSVLLLRNVQWLFTGQHVAYPLLGRPLQEALGLSTRKLLSVAAYIFVGCVDVNKILNAASTRGDVHVSRVMEGVYHANVG